MESCLYEGTVRHHRWRPVTHQFQYRLSLLYLDLQELDELAAQGYFARNSRWAAVSLCDEDYAQWRAGGVSLPVSLAESLRERIAAATGLRPAGPIRLLCQPRYFGYFFSPLNLYYCFDAAGQAVDTVVAEVNNIPWRERHWYVLNQGNRRGTGLRFEHPKGLHVSPFMPMDQRYRWRLSVPGERLTAVLENRDGGCGLRSKPQRIDGPLPWLAAPPTATQQGRLFTVTLALRRRELTRHWLTRTLWRHGWVSVQVVAAIYWQALLLWRKGCPVYAHPRESTSASSPSLTRPCKT